MYSMQMWEFLFVSTFAWSEVDMWKRLEIRVGHAMAKQNMGWIIDGKTSSRNHDISLGWEYDHPCDKVQLIV